MPKYGIQNALFSDEIHIGELNDDCTAFTSKEDHKDGAIAAVAEYITHKHNGQFIAEYADGTTYTITVQRGIHPNE